MMMYFMLNLVLALVYVMLTGEASFYTAVQGFIIGAMILTFAGLPFGANRYVAKIWRLLRFTGYFFKILLIANLQVAKEIISPGFYMAPRILRYSVKGMSEVQITTLASAITLTPGTLTADISPCGDYLYIHAMYARDPDEAIAELDELKDRIMEGIFK